MKFKVAAQWVTAAVLQALVVGVLAQGPAGEPLPIIGVNEPCRMVPKMNTCALPNYLANWQYFKAFSHVIFPLVPSPAAGNHQCAPEVRIGRPSTLEQLQAIVSAYPRVKAVGVGASWWPEQFCAGNTAEAIDVVTTELEPALTFIKNPVDPSTFAGSTVPPDFPIQVDEDAATVTAAAGITQRALLDYLANYTYWQQPQGWTLPAYSWFIDQTIGGAVSTATHGSSFEWGSLSSQLRGLKVVMANGTLLEITPESNPHLWRALGVSVGCLGVITEVTFRIVPNVPVTRTSRKLNFTEFVNELEVVQEAYKAAVAAGDADAARAALTPLDESSSFWVAPLGVVYRADFAYEGKPTVSAIPDIDLQTVSAMDGPAPLPGVYDQVPGPAVPPAEYELNSDFIIPISQTAEASVQSYVYNATVPRRLAFFSALSPDVKYLARSAPYNQLEVAVPLERAAECLRKVGDEMYGPAELWKGFRNTNLIRFTSGEPFYISPANGGPTLWVNFEDFVGPSGGGPNTGFERVVDIFIQDCGARLHWGKWGWRDHFPCWDGVEHYPETWCDFGCAVNELDPTGKFRGESWVWAWAATRGGQPADFASCCGPDGFKKIECTCASAPSCIAGAPAPEIPVKDEISPKTTGDADGGR